MVVGTPGQVRHRTCFRCARCSSQLTLASYYQTQRGDFCCETCPDEETRPTPPPLPPDTPPRSHHASDDSSQEESSEESEEESEDDESSTPSLASSHTSSLASSIASSHASSLTPTHAPGPPKPRTVFLTQTLNDAPATPPDEPSIDTAKTPPTSSHFASVSPVLFGPGEVTRPERDKTRPGHDKEHPEKTTGPGQAGKSVPWDDRMGPGRLGHIPAKMDAKDSLSSKHQDTYTPRTSSIVAQRLKLFRELDKRKTDVADHGRADDKGDERRKSVDSGTKFMRVDRSTDDDKLMEVAKQSDDDKLLVVAKKTSSGKVMEMEVDKRSDEEKLLEVVDQGSLKSSKSEGKVSSDVCGVDEKVDASGDSLKNVDKTASVCVSKEDVKTKDKWKPVTQLELSSAIEREGERMERESERLQRETSKDEEEEDSHGGDSGFPSSIPSISIVSEQTSTDRELTRDQSDSGKPEETERKEYNPFDDENEEYLGDDSGRVMNRSKSDDDGALKISQTNRHSDSGSVVGSGDSSALPAGRDTSLTTTTSHNKKHDSGAILDGAGNKTDDPVKTSDEKLAKKHKNSEILNGARTHIDDNRTIDDDKSTNKQDGGAVRVSDEPGELSDKDPDLSKDSVSAEAARPSVIPSIEYPDDLNPFGSDDDDDEEETESREEDKSKHKEVESADKEPQRKLIKANLNPFESDEEEAEAKEERKQKNLNPFWSDDEDESERGSEAGTPQKGKKVKPPRPPPPTLPRNSHAPNRSPSPSLTPRKKTLAPPPPLPSSAPPASPPSSARLSPASASPTGSVALRKKGRKAPAPPTATPPSQAKEGEDEVMGWKLQKDLKNHTNKLNSSDPSSAPPKPPRSPAQMTHTPLSHVSSGAGLIKKCEGGEWQRRKGPAPPRPVPQKRAIKKLPMRLIQQELQDIDIKQTELERQGVILETAIRKRTEDTSEESDTSISGPSSIEVEDMIMQLFELVNEKNELFRRQTELMYMKREKRLEEEYVELEYQIRCLMLKPPSERTEEDVATEERLIKRLVGVVEQRDEIINCLELDRLREAQEDESIATHMMQYQEKHVDGVEFNGCASQAESSASSSGKKKKTLKLPRKKKKKDKEKKNKKGAKGDADKDVDESEGAEAGKKKKKKWLF